MKEKTNDRNLKKLNRKQLLELMLAQQKYIDQLQLENQELQKQLQTKSLQMIQLGSINKIEKRLEDLAEQMQLALQNKQN